MNNGVNGTGTNNGEGASPGRCSLAQQQGPGRHPATAIKCMKDCGDDGGVERRKKRGRGIGWTDAERIWLYECYERSGGVKRGGYIKKVDDSYNSKNMIHRSRAAIIAQLKVIEGGGLTGLQKSEIKERIQKEKEDLEKIAKNWEELFGESSDESFEGFDEGEEEEVDEEGELDSVVNADPVMEAEVDTDSARGMDSEEMIEEVATWKNGDGSTRPMTNDEREVLELLKEARSNGKWDELRNLKTIDRKEIMREVKLVDGVMHNLLSNGMNVTCLNRLLYAGSVVVTTRLGFKIGKGTKTEKKNPWWQRRIENSIKVWRKELSQVEEIRKGTKIRDKTKAGLEKKYQLTDRGAMSVSTFLKNKIQAGSTKIRWFVEKRTTQRHNNLYNTNEKQLYKELGGDVKHENSETPDKAASKEFWENIWSVKAGHREDAGWLKDIKEGMTNIRKQQDVTISLDDVKGGIRKMKNWKAPGPDWVRGFWFKKFPSLHENLTEALKDCLESGETPEWMVKGRTVLIQKDPVKGTLVSNYRPIACLPLMWKLLTGIFAEKIYDHLLSNDLLPDEQKGCRKRSRGTKDQLMIDKAMLRDAKMKKRLLATAWIDYRKAYDMVPHSWILETLGMIKIAGNVERLLERSMDNWKTILTNNGETLGEVCIKRGIFQGDSLSPLLFIVAMIPLTLLLRKEPIGYQFGNNRRRVNHLLFMDDLKLFGKNKDELEKLCHLVFTFSKDIGMEFGMEKCAILVTKAGQKIESEGLELPDQTIMREADEKGYKYLGVLEATGIKNKEMKEMVKKEYYRRVKLLAGTKLYARYMIGAINTWAVSIVRYSAGILDWTESDLTKMDIKTRKILTMNGVHHKRSNVDRLYIKRKDGGRGLISVNECVRTEEANLRDYVLHSEEWMLKVVADSLEGGLGKEELKKQMETQRKDSLYEKRLHGKFFREVKEVADEKSWQWMRGGFLDKRTEGFVCAAQENVLQTNCYKVTIMKQGDNVKCRKCGKEAETVGHLISGCEMLAQNEYKRRHDKMGLRIYWELCKKYGIQAKERWYEEVPDPVRKSADSKIEIWWDQKVVTPTVLEHSRPDLVVIDHEKRKHTLVDFSVPFDPNVVKKEDEKIQKYGRLATEISRMKKVQVETIPVVVGALGVVSKRLKSWLEQLGIPDMIGGLQTATIIGSAAILRKVLCTNT